MRISVDADGIVTARFIAEHAFVRSMIEQQLPELRADAGPARSGAGRCQRGRRRSGPRLGRRPGARPCRGTPPGRSSSFGPESSDEDAADDHAEAISSLSESFIDIRV